MNIYMYHVICLHEDIHAYVIYVHGDVYVLCNWLTCQYRCMMYYVHMKTYMCYAIYLHEGVHVSGIDHIFALCSM